MNYFAQPQRNCRRIDPEATQWMSQCTSLEILPQLGLSWSLLEALTRNAVKPVGDLGASYSTLSVEGALRGIEIVPVDFAPTFTPLRYRERVTEAMQTIRHIYEQSTAGEGALPAGFSFSGKVADFAGSVQDAITSVVGRHLRADIATLPVPDRAFSVTLVNDSLPKFSSDVGEFFSKELPSILRVTDSLALISPFIKYSATFGFGCMSQKIVQPSIYLFSDTYYLHQAREVARSHGFIFDLRPGVMWKNPNHPEQYHAPDNFLAAFTRVRR